MTSTLIVRPPSVFQRQLATYIPEALASKYGSGLALPAACLGKEWVVDTGEAKIQASIFVIMSTAIGSRIDRPDFGSMLPYLTFEPYGETLRSELVFYTRDALIKWEPRIVVSDVFIGDADMDQNTVTLTVVYAIKGVDRLSRYAIPMQLHNPGGSFTPPGSFTVSGQRVIK